MKSFLRANIPLNERVNPIILEPEQLRVRSFAFGNAAYAAHYNHGRPSTSGLYQMEPFMYRKQSFQIPTSQTLQQVRFMPTRA